LIPPEVDGRFSEANDFVHAFDRLSQTRRPGTTR
jgi:hypothetical protein